jgi:hypothetical protein
VPCPAVPAAPATARRGRQCPPNRRSCTEETSHSSHTRLGTPASGRLGERGDQRRKPPKRGGPRKLTRPRSTRVLRQTSASVRSHSTEATHPRGKGSPPTLHRTAYERGKTVSASLSAGAHNQHPEPPTIHPPLQQCVHPCVLGCIGADSPFRPPHWLLAACQMDRAGQQAISGRVGGYAACDADGHLAHRAYRAYRADQVQLGHHVLLELLGHGRLAHKDQYSVSAPDRDPRPHLATTPTR